MEHIQVSKSRTNEQSHAPLIGLDFFRKVIQFTAMYEAPQVFLTAFKNHWISVEDFRNLLAQDPEGAKKFVGIK